METIAIYGGAFNPPTVAHSAVAESCLRREVVAEVWLMPSADRFDKTIPVDTKHRLALLQLLAESLHSPDSLKISRMELEELPAPTQTRLTFLALSQRFPDTNFTFVVGSDTYQRMPTWEGGHMLQRQLQMLVVPRQCGELSLTANAQMLEVAASRDISSTEVRRRVKADESIAGLVAPAIEAYIYKHELYR